MSQLAGRHGRRRPLRDHHPPRLGRHGRRLLREDLQLGRKVALKLLHARFAEDEEFVERFRREASSAAGLAHPNVVSVYDRGEWEGTYYIAMEFVSGRTLKQIIVEEAPLDPAARDRPDGADPARRALRAPPRDHPPRLQAAQRHRRRRGPREGHRLRHRPRRRVGHDGDRLDHGHRAVPLARAGAGPRRQRAVGPLLGRDHPLRAAHRPRAVRGRVGGDDRAQAGLRGAGAAEPSSTRASRRELEAVVLRALAKEPRERFADADEFIAALEAAASRIPSPRAIAAAEAAAAALPAAAAVGGGGVMAPPPPPPAPPRRPPPARRTRRPACYPRARGAPRAVVAPLPAPPPAERKRWPWIVLGGLALLGLVLLLVSVLSPQAGAGAERRRRRSPSPPRGCGTTASRS